MQRKARVKSKAPAAERGTARVPALVTLADIERARDVLADHIIDTKFEYSRTLSDMIGAGIWLKFENLQFTGSFKERGALNRLNALSAAERRRGVITMSAGNHAQGVAYHAARLAIPATIVMPEPTPTIKVENTRQLGARVVLEGPTLEEAAAHAHRLAAEQKLTFVHPYDDALVIAGQGTMALEMLKAEPDIDVIVVPIGGGGLISGIAVAAKALKPSIRIIGVQAALYPSMYNRIKEASLPMRGDSLAEGIAVKSPGEITSRHVRELVDDIVLVAESDIERALSLLLAIEKTVVEGAGAAALAAVMADPQRFAGQRVALTLCGGNIDTRLLASVLTRGLARDGRLSQLSIDIPDRPGQLARVSSVVGGEGANIVEVYHQRVFTVLPAKGAELHVVIETRDRDHLRRVLESLERAGYAVEVKGAAVAR
ncbi:MAG: threonine ammonia-lyase [Hyphomicrobiaceae bacterium]|nr:threonine ammonia-lyase [Hyphomicrobiaceae bacterium]